MKKLLPTKLESNIEGNPSVMVPLTAKERLVLEFIEQELLTKGLSPSYQEICNHFGFASFNSVQNYLKQLAQKGYVQLPQNQKRAIVILHSAKDFTKDLSQRLQHQHLKDPSEQDLQSSFNPSSTSGNDSKVLSIPFLGRVAAGSPIERLHDNEFIQIPSDLIKAVGDYFALRVEGDSMIEEGIFDGDFLIVLSQKAAKDGDLVVASIEQEATVKRFFHKKNTDINPDQKLIELRPANPRLTSMWYQPQQVEIKGLVKALFRKY